MSDDKTYWVPMSRDILADQIGYYIRTNYPNRWCALMGGPTRVLTGPQQRARVAHITAALIDLIDHLLV